MDVQRETDAAALIAERDAEIVALRARIEESEETLRALRRGEVDAIVVGDDVFTLAGADAESNRLRGDALAQMEDLVVAANTDAHVIYLNPAAERQFSKDADDILGLPISQLFVPEWLSETDRLDCQRSLDRGEFWRGQTRVFAAGQPGLQLECTYSVMHNEAGERTGFLTVMRDISARANAEAALAESQARLNFALGSARIGDWSLDTGTGNARGSLRHYACFGYDTPVEDWTRTRFLSHVHSDDRSAVDHAMQVALDTSGECHFECRVIWPDSTIHWIEVHGSVFLKSGEPDRMVGTIADITERKFADEALRDADRRKDEFLATLSHELRNPLAPIRNAAQILSMKPLAEGVLSRTAAIIQRQVTQMGRLLDDLLDVARVTRGQLSLRKDYVELQEIVLAAIETARPAIDSRQQQLRVNLPIDKIWLEADQVRLAQVVSNLLNNAAKYSDKCAVISISAGVMRDKFCYLSVKDTGIGLTATAIRSVFDMFAQEDSALERSEGGLGIGLALVKGLVELHGGTVVALSEGLGKGSEFMVRLPYRPDHGAQHRAADAADSTRQPSDHLCLVIADDNVDAAESLATLLEMAGHNVFVGNDGIRALQLAADHHPSIMLLDIGMPGLNGYEVAKRVRQEAWGKKILLIAATGWGQEDDRSRSRAAGFDAHLTKPFNPEDLMKLIGERSRALR